MGESRKEYLITNYGTDSFSSMAYKIVEDQSDNLRRIIGGDFHSFKDQHTIEGAFQHKQKIYIPHVRNRAV